MTPVDASSIYGTLNLLILRAVSGGPLHGLAIQRHIREVSGDGVQVEVSALYPALHRLEREGLLEGEWGRGEGNRRAKFYRLTQGGHERLARETARWVEHVQAVARLLDVGAPAR